MAISLIFNFGLLGIFKYYNFFLDSFVNAYSFLGQSIEASRLDIILPVGISFYTFQTLSYTIDIFRKKIEPTTDIISFFAFVSFFPQLVAGPIERASNLLPQFEKNRSFSYDKAVDGTRQMLWGFFKKVVVADNCALIVDIVFTNSETLSGPILILGAVLFAFQIYCDFSGYSDIAIGLSRLLGFNLMQNFAFPYFSRDISEFWRRWHISLSTWFRDYLYIPLGGSRVGSIKKVRNIFAIFLVSGFWHGANWTFLIWGFIHSLLYLIYVMLNKNRTNLDTINPKNIQSILSNTFQVVTTFIFVTIAWVFFRSDNLSSSIIYLQNMIYKADESIITSLARFKVTKFDLHFCVFAIVILLLIEWCNRFRKHGLENMPKLRVVRYSVYVFLALLVVDSFHGEKSFIYFQF